MATCYEALPLPGRLLWALGGPTHPRLLLWLVLLVLPPCRWVPAFLALSSHDTSAVLELDYFLGLKFNKQHLVRCGFNIQGYPAQAAHGAVQPNQKFVVTCRAVQPKLTERGAIQTNRKLVATCGAIQPKQHKSLRKHWGKRESIRCLFEDTHWDHLKLSSPKALLFAS